MRAQGGNVLFYILMAIALFAALAFAMTQGGRDSVSTQNAARLSEELYAQANMIRAAILQCALEYPKGGGDIAPGGAADGVIDSSDNPNNPYPLNPSSALNPYAPAALAAAANDNARNLTCVGAPATEARMFQGSGNQGRFLPPQTGGFTEWSYGNDSDGVYLRITADNDSTAVEALNRLTAKFDSCQADLASCGSRCFTLWIVKAAGC